eukprot:GCRY01002481.1.p1 GENE.GCRY01002481.1~~GCRY01002481.1.p1  ORF type:complete len:677 (+),score=148.99 GCRY01002481.1:133-2163(+)
MNDKALFASQTDTIFDWVKNHVLEEQSDDGSWRVFYEGSVLGESYMIMQEVMFPPTDNKLVSELADSIARLQAEDGGWPLYPGSGGHYNTTIEAYIALRVAGYPCSHPVVAKAATFLCERATTEKISSLTRILLCACGIMDYSDMTVFPVEFMLLPKFMPLNLYSFVAFTRVHLPAFMITAAYKVQNLLQDYPDVVEEVKSFLLPSQMPIHGGAVVNTVYHMSHPLRWACGFLPTRTMALKRARQYILDMIEPDGSVGSYILSTLFSMVALRAMGYESDKPHILGMKEALRSWVVDRGFEKRFQVCTSTIWDTAFSGQLLLRLGLEENHDSLKKGIEYLLQREITEFPGLSVRNPSIWGSAWGFQDINMKIPDVDDTCAVLNLLQSLPESMAPEGYQKSIKKTFGDGVHWVLAMQNSDGGWGAFDKDVDNPLVENIPFNDMRRAMIDPSVADMTGRTSVYIMHVLRESDPVNTAHLPGKKTLEQSIVRALRWLELNQEGQGEWFGRWMVPYVFGTRSALLAFGSAGVRAGETDEEYKAKLADPQTLRSLASRRESVRSVEKAIQWLRENQNADGGWGESCNSDWAGHYIRRFISTPTQTAWALEGLLATMKNPLADEMVQRGVQYLLDHFDPAKDGWQNNYPVGTGFANKLYLHYHPYAIVYPTTVLLKVRQLLSN